MSGETDCSPDKWTPNGIPAKGAVDFSGNKLFPQLIDGEGCYSCFYCGCDCESLVQFGYEASSDEEWSSRKRMVSPEDANAVEVCRECLVYAFGLLGEADCG